MNWLLIVSIALPIANSQYEKVNAVTVTETSAVNSSNLTTTLPLNISNTTIPSTTMEYYTTTPSPKGNDSLGGLIVAAIFGGIVLLYFIFATIWWMRNNNICYTTSCINKICPVCFMETCCECCDNDKYLSNYTHNPNAGDDDCGCLVCGCCFKCCTKPLSCEDDSLYTKYLIKKAADHGGIRQGGYSVYPTQYQTFSDFKKDHHLRKLLEKPKRDFPAVDVATQPAIMNAIIIDD